jgi:hypothetical protein
MLSFKPLSWFVISGAALLVAACSPKSPEPTVVTQPTHEAAPMDAASAENAITTLRSPPTPSHTPTAALAATPRGPELGATNPEGVRLDVGGLQMVEFFRFT